MAYRRAPATRRRSTRRSGRPTRQSYRKATRPRVRRAQAPRRAKQPCLCPGELTPTAKFALAQLDPFDPKCLGAKIPDSNSMPSLANADTDQEVLTTAAGQNTRAIAFWPTYAAAVMRSGYANATPDTISWQYGSGGTPPDNLAVRSNRRNATNVQNAIEGIRPVAHAIRISSALSPTAATGFVHVGLAVEATHTANSNIWELPNTVSQMTGLAHYKRFTIASLTQSPITIINKWIDDTAFRYNRPETTPAAVTGTGNFGQFEFGVSWGQLVVLVEGAPANSNVVSIEHILLTEMLPKKDSFILGTTAAPNSPDTMSAVSTMVSNTDFAHTEAGQEGYIQQGLSALNEGGRLAGEQVMQNVVLPAARQYGYNLGMRAMSVGVGMLTAAMTGRGGIPGLNANPNRAALT